VSIRPEETLETLKRRSRQERVRREARTRELRAGVLRVTREYLGPGARAWLIGSLAWGGFGERSDVDLVVDQLSPECAAELERALADLAGCEVDLLRLAELSPAFRERVLETGIEIHDERA
jgi:predicted nucleotidyltransferase